MRRLAVICEFVVFVIFKKEGMVKRICMLLIMMVSGWGLLTAQYYHLGDIYTAPDGSQGVVFYLFPDGSGGWAVALNDASTGCAWGNVSDIPGLANQAVTYYQMLLTDTSGYTNTQHIRNYQNNGNYAANVVDFDHGWYLPSPAQLRLIHAVMPQIGNVFVSAGGTKMAKDYYWCSAEQYDYSAWQVDFGHEVYHGRFLPADKSTLARVRAVRTFTYTPSYLWSTGETTASVTVAPEQTTAYSVTVFSQANCSDEDSLTLFVSPMDTTALSVTACDYYTWDGVTYDTSGTYTKHCQNVNGCDSVVVMTLTVLDHPSRSETWILNQGELPYYYAPADTVIPSGSPDTVQFTYSAAAESGCDTIVSVTLLFLEMQPLSVTVTSQINTRCDGNGCQYDGPTILINEVMLRPTVGDGSIVGDVLPTPAEGEWIELYNPHKCESVDISGYFLGNNAFDYMIDQGGIVQGDWGGGFALPPGTVVPAQGFCVVRGPLAPAVPANLLVENGGKTVEVIVNSRYCFDTGGRRLWFPNNGGWFAFYNAQGVPQDAIFWGDTSNFCPTCPPCTPTAGDIAFTGTLASFNGIPGSKKSYIANVIATGMSLRRVPDGGAWSSSFVPETYGTCNSTCVDPPVITCNGYAVAQVTGGLPPFTYLWDDPQAQTTDTAFQLCAGNYTVLVTDALGETVTAQVAVTDFVPLVSHPDVQFCFSESSGVLQGTPGGGTYEGAPVTGNTLSFQENVTQYQMTYTYTDANGCSASAPFQVTVVPNTREMDTTVCSSDLPYLWYNQPLTAAGTYQKTVPTEGLCDSLLTLHLTVIQQPQLVVDDDVTIEPGETVTLHASGATTYLWAPAAGLSSPHTATPQASPSQSTLYYVTGYATESCSAMDSVAVLVYQHQDTTVCENELPLTWHGLVFEDTVTQFLTIPHTHALDEVWQLHLHLLPVTYSSYSFDITENEIPFVFNGLSFTGDVDTTFVVPNSYGCDSVILFTLSVCWNAVSEVDSVVCEYDLPFVWNGVWVTEANDYQAGLNTFCGADSTVLMHLSVIGTEVQILPLTHDFCEDQTMELTVETSMPDYRWSTGETAPTVTVTHPGIYSVTASQGDCQGVAFYQVHSCHRELYLPNAITPSRGDGLNDCFSVPEAFLSNISLFEISLFNRWGELVFHSTDKNFKWNGEYKGAVQYQTQYNYIIEYTDSSGRPHRLTGTVTVL